MEHVATVRVIFGDTDAAGIVYYGNYLRWFEVGRAELMRRKGFSYLVTMERGVLLPVIEASARYLASARYDDLLRIHAEIRDVQGVRMTFGYRIERDDGTSLVTGHTVHAFTGRDGRPVRPPAEFRNAVAFVRHFPGKGGLTMERNLAMEVVRVTEAAALAAARLMGRGDNIAADQAAVTAMRKALSFVQFKGRVVIGEGERDEAPMLYIGEEVGASETPKVDIAVDPLEGTNIVSAGGYNAIAVIAIAEEGGFLHAPDTYMQKLAVGPKARGVIDITATPTENLRRIAKAQKAYVEDLCVVILDRPRHQDLIREVREAGARIKLIGDGDVAGAIATSKEGSGVDVLMGTGGAPEGVLAAAALKCMGGDFQGVLKFRNKEEIDRAKVMGVTDLNRVYALNDLASSDVMFAATGVTFGDFLKGVRFFSGGAYTQSVVMRSRSRTTRVIDTTHYFEFKPKYE